MYLIWWTKSLVNSFGSKTGKGLCCVLMATHEELNKINAWVFSSFSSLL